MENLPRAGGGDLLVHFVADVTPVIAVARQHKHHLHKHIAHMHKNMVSLSLILLINIIKMKEINL